jgi:hypothetical protein
MHRHVSIGLTAITVACGASLWLAAEASSQSLAPVRLTAWEGTTAGRVHGLVRDAAGRGVADASILAVGLRIVSARSDAAGRFVLSLPPGDYVLRASRDGYVSTYREPVRVDTSTRLERNITLMRQEAALVDAADDAHSHTDSAWRLRHLRRSVLRDGSTVVPGEPDRTGDRSERLALAFARTDFRGGVNFVTTTVSGPAASWMPGSWPRGVAYVSLGAPVPGHGAWHMRAAVAAGDGSSWNVLGEYESDVQRAHAWKLRMSYSAQGYLQPAERLSAGVAEVRTVAGVSGQDRWRIGPALEVDYGLRAERFDYLADPYLFSGNAGFLLRVLPRTHVRASAARQMFAPGADEFLPPSNGAQWLPAERTFFPLSGRGVLAAEEVRHAEIMLVQELGRSAAEPAVHVRRFRQRVHNQLSTLFGVPGDAGRGQYFVAPLGTVDLVGWAVGWSGRFSRRFTGQVEYARVAADWHRGRRTRDVRRAAPSVLRAEFERLHDVTATFEADVTETSTQVSVVYRGSSGFSRDAAARSPRAGSRFDLQVRQALPYQPVRGGRVELLFSVRNLFRDGSAAGAWYDELLTAGPPVRFMTGIQVRF